MENNLQLQRELSLVWSSRVQQIKELTENGEDFKLMKPMYLALNFSQRNYQSILHNVRKRLRFLRRQMRTLNSSL